MRVGAFLPVAVLVLSVALAGCGDVGDQDRDDDGLYDSSERRGWDVTVDSLTERTLRHVTSKVRDFDSDDDGIPDNDEFFFGSDPMSADTDGDGLSDCQEVRHRNLAECEDPDFSGPFDGGYSTEPTKADSDPGVSLYVLNSPFTDHTGTLPNGRPGTGDGISDGEEVAGYTITLGSGATRRITTDPRNGDSDGDALDDGEERYQFQGDPTVRDTDGDGCEDGVDPLPGKAQRYRIGLGNFTLLRGGSADLRLTLIAGNVPASAPASGTIPVQQGQAKDLSGYDPGPLTPTGADCRISPRHPWALVQVAAESRGSSLDIASGTGGANVASLWLNVRTGEVALAERGPAVALPYLVRGADGTLELAPRVEA